MLAICQAERGNGIWSTHDPEIWIGDIIMGKLGLECDIHGLVQDVLGALSESRIAAG